ncbi:hypothetical protein LXL04_002918 [Taraxacum kok-saghyz]
MSTSGNTLEAESQSPRRLIGFFSMAISLLHTGENDMIREAGDDPNANGTLSNTPQKFKKRRGLKGKYINFDSASKLDSLTKGKDSEFTLEPKGCNGHFKLENSTPMEAKSELEDVMGDSDWEDGSNPNLNSETGHENHINKDISIEIDASPDNYNYLPETPHHCSNHRTTAVGTANAVTTAVPMGVLKTLEQVRSRFFRGVDRAGKKMAWISWDKVCASKQKGGMGVGSFYALNRALLFKWVWRFKSQPCAFWVKVVKAIHGAEDSTGSPRASIWRDITRSGVDLVNKGIDLQLFCKKIIGDGVNTRFWKEIWLGNSMLQTAFPHLYALEEDKDVSVAAKFSQPWNASFRRPMLGGAEAAQGQELSVLLHTVHLNQLPDKWVWDLSSDGQFTVASTRHYLDDTLLGGSSNATRWVSLVPIKVNVLAWKMMCDALPTRWNLSQRGLELNSMLCPICGEKVEDVEHLFFKCSFASEITDKVVRWWGFSTSSFSSLQGWKGWMDGVRLRNKMKEVLECVFFVTWWSIWKFKNQMVFGSVLPSKIRHQTTDRVRHQTTDRVRHQNTNQTPRTDIRPRTESELSLRFFWADRVRGKTSDRVRGPSPSAAIKRTDHGPSPWSESGSLV